MQFLTAISLALSMAQVGLAAPAPVPATAPIVNADSANAIPQSYLVVLKKNTDTATKQKVQDFINTMAKNRNINSVGVASTVNLSTLSAYSIQADNATIAQLQANAAVDFIEKDTPVQATYVSIQKPSQVDKRFLIQQKTGPWGLYRISHKSAAGLLSGLSNYVYDVVTGYGSRVYVIDSGIQTTHVEFGGRAVWGANFIADSPDTDELGHGTHVAGTIGSKSYGVAKLSTLVAVKVLDGKGSGTMSGVIQGVQWAVNDAVGRGTPTKTVINLSLGGGYSAALNAALSAAIAQGVTVVVAAGNNGDDASTYSPASAPGVIAVGATDSTDNRPSWSNYGASLKIFAPGDSIQSTWIGASNSETMIMSGTSMASPHVAGLTAYLITKQGASTPLAAWARIRTIASRVTIGSAGDGSPNLIAYNGSGS